MIKKFRYLILFFRISFMYCHLFRYAAGDVMNEGLCIFPGRFV